MKEYFTIGQILKKGLLLNRYGVPYKDKANVSRVVNSLPFKRVKTIWGEAKAITKEQIKEYNEFRVNNKRTI